MEYFHNIWDMFRENHNWLVVDLPTPLKNDGVLVTVGMITFPTEWKVIKFHGSKPPTRYITIIFPLLLVYTLFLITINHHIFNQTYGKIMENHHFSWRITPRSPIWIVLRESSGKAMGVCGFPIGMGSHEKSWQLGNDTPFETSKTLENSAVKLGLPGLVN